MERRPHRRLLDRLSGGPVLADGAMGTLLSVEGGGWMVPEELIFRAPERVAAAHAAYAAAGADLVETNTFGGSPAKLALVGLEAAARAVNLAAARIAREAVGPDVLVAGSIGPTGQFLEPLGDLSPAAAEAGFALQAEALAEGGADLMVVETMSAVDEARAALRGALRAGLPVVCTMTFEANGRTVMGVKLPDLLELLGEGAVAVGVNCGQGPDVVADLIARLRALAPAARLVAQPNAGAPRLAGGAAVWDVTPDEMARFARQMRSLGVAIIGGCCGNTPEHVRAMRAELGGGPPPP